MENRIWLDELKLDDRDAVFSLTSRPEIVKYMHFNTHESPEEAEALIRHYTEGENHGFLIRLLEGGELIGVAAVKREEEGEDEEEGVFSVSLFSFPEYWNRGYSTEALKLLIKFAFKRGVRSLKAYIVEENYGSRRVAEKCGFRVKEVLHFDDFPSGLYVYTLPLDTGRQARE